MKVCSKCGKKLNFLSHKYQNKDGSVLCSSCYEKLKSEQHKKNVKIVTDYFSKYLSNKEVELSSIILFLNQNNDINRLIDLHSLSRIKKYYITSLQNIKNLKNKNISTKEILNMTTFIETVLDFLNDFEKMYKIFKKKQIKTNYVEILSLFSNVIESNINKNYEEIIGPFRKKFKEFGNTINKETLIREFLYNYLEPDTDKNIINEMVSRLLDKFNINYDKERLSEIIENILEDIDLEKFENGLGSSPKIKIVDWDELTGHEFENYLTYLFKLLGYSVTQTPLSGDQGADLVLTKNGTKTIVQAKKYTKKVTNKAVQEIVAAINYYKVDNAIVVTNSTFTKSALDLAHSNNVELWDGIKLMNIIKEINRSSNDTQSSETYIDNHGYQEFAEEVETFLNKLETNKTNLINYGNVFESMNMMMQGIDELVTKGLVLLARKNEIERYSKFPYNMLKLLVEGGVSTLHSYIFLSLKVSFENPKCIQLTDDESEEFNKFYEEVKKYRDHDNFIGIKEYDELKNKIEELDKSKKIEGFLKIFIGLENLFEYNDKISILNSLNIRLEEAKNVFFNQNISS